MPRTAALFMQRLRGTGRFSKGIGNAGNALSEVAKARPDCLVSQPVRSLRFFSAWPENVRHVRRLGEYLQVSMAEKSRVYAFTRRV
jgi:hypothetical protein